MFEPEPLEYKPGDYRLSQTAWSASLVTIQKIQRIMHLGYTAS